MENSEREKRIKELEQQNEILRSENERLKAAADQRWALVEGSSWEAHRATTTVSTNTTSTSVKFGTELVNVQPKHLKLRKCGVNVRMAVATAATGAQHAASVAYRQIKYELFCASADLLGFSLYVDADRTCTVRTVHQVHGASLCFEFVYDRSARRYVDMVWSEDLRDYIHIYKFWVLERQCIPGFLAQLLLQLCETFGSPPCRPRVMH